MPTFGVPQISLGGFTDQNLSELGAPPPCKVGFIKFILESVVLMLTNLVTCLPAYSAVFQLTAAATAVALPTGCQH